MQSKTERHVLASNGPMSFTYRRRCHDCCYFHSILRFVTALSAVPYLSGPVIIIIIGWKLF
jgi:hypothetical protein